MTPTVSDLGKKVKAKFPGSYDDLDDAELGRKTKSKFPGSYDDFADTPPSPPLGKSVPGASMIDSTRSAQDAYHDPLPQFGKNVVTSAGRFAGNVASAVAHPIDTVSNLGQVAFGGVEKPVRLAGNVITGNNTPPTPEEEKFNNVASSYGQRYGSPSKIANTLYTDPVGALADASAVAGGVAGAAKLGGLGRAAAVAGAVSEATNPISMAGKAAGAAVPTGLAQKAAIKLYTGALKPTLTQADSLKDSDALINTGLREQIPVSRSGFQKASEKIDAINNSTKARIAAGAAAGDTVDPAVVASPQYIRPPMKQVNPDSDVAARVASSKEFLRNNPAPIPVDEAQAMKQGTYRKLQDSYGEQASAAREIQKDLARGLKSEVYKLYPELQAQGIQEGELIDLKDAIERAAIRHGKKDIVGIHGVSSIGPWIVKQLVDNPEVKSQVAILLNKAASKKLGIPGASGLSAPAQINSQTQPPPMPQGIGPTPVAMPQRQP